jgi:hypothetical protein
MGYSRVGQMMLALSGFFLAAATGTRALAHDLPEARFLLWASESPDERPIVLMNRGLLFPESAGGLHYSLRCNEAYGATVTEHTHARLYSEQGLFLLSSGHALLSDDRACTFRPAQGLPSVTFGGFSEPRARGAELLLSTIVPDAQSQVFASADRGASWSVRATNAQGEVYTALLAAPSDPERVYASGARVNRSDNTIEHLWASSLDGGAHWQSSVVPRELTPLAVHPDDPQIVFAYELADDSGTSYHVQRSEDGGTTFLTVLEGVSEPSSFAATPDAKVMWLGIGHEGGLYESRTGGASFVRMHEDIHEVHCLHERLGKLWLCGNRAPNVDGVWVSADLGKSFEQVLTFDQVTEPVHCGVPAEALCKDAWDDWVLEIFDGKDPSRMADAGAGQAASDAGPSDTFDAGKGKEPEKHAGGCASYGQRRGGTRASMVGLTVLSLALVLLARAPGRTRSK